MKPETKKRIVALAIVLAIAISLLIFILKNFYPLLLLSLVCILFILHYKYPPQEKNDE